MHQLSFFAYHSEAPQSLKRLQCVRDAFAQFYGYTNLANKQVAFRCDPHLGIAVFAPISNLVKVPLVFDEGDTVGVSLHLPFGAADLLGAKTIMNGRYIGEIVRSPELAQRMDPPLAMCEYDGHAIRIANDALGSGRLYEFTSEGLTVWSNRPAAGYFLAGMDPEPDPLGWQYLAALGWFGGSETPYRHVKKLDAGTTLMVTERGELFRTRIDLAGLFQMDAALTDERIAAVSHAVLRKFLEVDRMVETGPLQIGLSGGRDSRIVAATAIKAGLDVEFHTAYPPEKELEIAQDLVNRAPVPLNWRTTDRRDVISSEYPPNSLNDGLNALFPIADGDSNVTQIHRIDPTQARMIAPLSKIALSGFAGEFGHANGYVELSQGAELRIKNATKAYLKVPFVNEQARAALASLYERTIEAGRSIGLSSFYLLDFWYARTRFRRWGGGNLAVETIGPLCTMEFVRTAFAMDPAEKLSATLHRRVVDHVLPEWRGVPFFFEAVAGLPHSQGTNTGSLPTWWETPRWPEVRALLGDSQSYGAEFERDELLHVLDDPAARIPENIRVRVQNLLDRVLWRIGFEAYLSRIRQAVSAIPAD